jgi:hypothetical protein
MPYWYKKLKVSRHLDPESDTSLTERVDRIEKEFGDAGLQDEGLRSALAGLREAAETGKVEWFDASLEALYDWADDNRVWLGP